MKSEYYGSADKKKRYIKNWIESKVEYKKKKNVANALKIISLAILLICIIVPVVILLGNETLISGIAAGFIVGLIIAMIPFFIGESIRIKAYSECGTPFTEIQQECLRVYEDGVEYLYHNSSSDYSKSMDVYRIPIENINAVNYDSDYHFVTIIGEGELLAYDDYAAKRLNHQKSQRKFYSNTPYSIISTFDDEDQVINLLKSMAKNKQ